VSRRRRFGAPPHFCRRAAAASSQRRDLESRVVHGVGSSMPSVPAVCRRRRHISVYFDPSPELLAWPTRCAAIRACESSLPSRNFETRAACHRLGRCGRGHGRTQRAVPTRQPRSHAPSVRPHSTCRSPHLLTPLLSYRFFSPNSCLTAFPAVAFLRERRTRCGIVPPLPCPFRFSWAYPRATHAITVADGRCGRRHVVHGGAGSALEDRQSAPPPTLSARSHNPLSGCFEDKDDLSASPPEFTKLLASHRKDKCPSFRPRVLQALF
jgi:hypothetical protein